MEKPKIRFLKNKNSWVRNTFEEIAKRRTKSSDNPDLPRIEYQDIISGEGRLSKDLNKNIDCRKGIVFETNDILYGKLRPYLKNWLHPNFNGIALGDFWVLQARNCDSKFLFSLVQSPKFQRVANDTSGTKMPRSDWKTVSQTEFSIPTSNDEQSAIGSLFRTLDELLTSYKDNLVNYQSLKAAMLSKMFPQAGQTIPEIRLDGFEGEWEVVNLGTLIENFDEVISGTSGFPIATSSRKGLYLQNDYFEGGRTGIDLTLDFHRVPIGYVTYRHMSDDSIFKFNKNNFETDVLVSKEYPVFISNNRSDIDFLLYHLNNSRLFLRFSTMQKLGGTRVRLYYKNLITYKLAVPTVKEQQAIGIYFSNLDNLINSHQEKISQLETLKKKLLQDMFI